MTGPVRVLALWSPDWPVTAAARAAHVPPERPAAVVVANRVLACSAVARASGSGVGCAAARPRPGAPSSWCWPATPTATPGCSSRSSGPSRSWRRGWRWSGRGCWRCPSRAGGYFGGELRPRSGSWTRWRGAPGWSARPGSPRGCSPRCSPPGAAWPSRPGDAPAFLAPLEVEELDREPEVDRSELVGLLRRLGLRSLGAFGALARGRRGVPVRGGRGARAPAGPRPGPAAAGAPVAARGAGRRAGAGPAGGPGGRRRVRRPRRWPSGCTGCWPGTGCRAPGSGSARARWRGRSCTGSGGAPSRSRRPAPWTGCAGSSTPGWSGAGRSRRPAAAGARGDGRCGRAAARALGRRRGGGRAGGPGAGAGAGAARAGGGGHRGARRRPRPGGAGPARALGGRPRVADNPAATVTARSRQRRRTRPVPRPQPAARPDPGTGAPPPWPGRLPAPSPAVVPAGPAARRAARRRGAPRSASPPRTCSPPPPHARRRRRPARDGARLGGAVAGVAAVVGAGRARRGAGCRCVRADGAAFLLLAPRRPLVGDRCLRLSCVAASGHAGIPSVESAKRPIVPATASTLRSSAVRSIPSVRSQAWW